MQEDMGGSMDEEHRGEQPFEKGPANPANPAGVSEERRLRQLCHENQHLRQVIALRRRYAGAIEALLTLTQALYQGSIQALY